MKRPPDFIIGNAKDPYLRRWWVIPRNRFFNIYLHNIVRDDDDRALHDHPWPSISFVLRGKLTEVLENRSRVLRKWVPYPRSSKAAHRLVVGSERGTNQPKANVWTLFFTGPRIREWGFHCPKGWVHWKLFTNPKNKGEVGVGCGEMD